MKFHYVKAFFLKAFPYEWNCMYRSSHRRSSVRKGVLRNFAKFIRKHLRQSLYFNKVTGLVFRKKGALRNVSNFTENHLRQSLFLIKFLFQIKTLALVFSCKFCEFSKNTFFTEHVRTTASICKTLIMIMIIIKCYL